MQVYTTFLSEYQLEKDFNHLYYGNGEEVWPQVAALLNAVNTNAKAFLKAISALSDDEVQESCRTAAVAQMYHAYVDYRNGYPYAESSGYGDVFLCFKDSTAMISGQGEVIFDEGRFWLNPKANFRGGWAVRTPAGQQGKYGYVNNAGKVVLPCVFDDFRDHIGDHCPILNGGAFSLNILGKLSGAGWSFTKQLCYSERNDRDFIGVSEDGVIYHLMPWGVEAPYDEGKIEDLKVLLRTED